MVRCVLKLGLMALAMGFAGCNTTQLLMAPGGSQSAYAPVNEATRPGLIRYVWSGDQDTERHVVSMRMSACGTHAMASTAF